MKDYEKCYRKFNLFSKKPLVVGRYEDYGGAILDTGNSRIFVHDNVVYRQCTNSRSHEGAAGSISFDVNTSLRYTFGNTFRDMGSMTLNVFNYHGCCSTYGKEPDFSFVVRPPFEKDQRYPVIVGEIGVSHEDQHMLFLEAMTYLNGFTDIKYCILVNILLGKPFFYARIVVCERTLESSNLNESERKDFIAKKKGLKRNRRKLKAAGIESDVCKGVKDKSGSINREEVEKNYHFRIIFDHTIRLSSASEMITCDLVFYLNRDLLTQHTGINTTNIPELIPIRIKALTLNTMVADFNKTKPSSSSKKQ